MIVPTICRPDELRACLESVAAQTRPPDEVVVVLPTARGPCDKVVDEFRERLVLREDRGSEEGIVAAVNKGLVMAAGDVVCLLDDDAMAPPHWLRRVERWFRDGRVGAAAGPLVPPGKRLEDMPPTARWDALTWFGYSYGPRNDARLLAPQRAHFLQEGNLAFRRASIGKIDTRLVGRDERFGDDITLPLLRRGLHVVADPELFAWHAHVRFAFEPERVPAHDHVYASAHNQTYLWLKHFPPWRRPIFLAFGLLVGDRTVKGFGAFLVWVLRNVRRPARARAILRLVAPTLRGRLDGLRTYRAMRRSSDQAGPRDSPNP